MYWQASAHPSRDEALEWKKIFVVKHGSKFTFDILAFNAQVMKRTLIEMNTPLNISAGHRWDKSSKNLQQEEIKIMYTYRMNRRRPNAIPILGTLE